MKDSPTLTIIPDSFPIGEQTLTISGSGYKREQDLQLITSRRSIWVTCDTDGTFTTSWTDDFRFAETAAIAAVETDQNPRMLAFAHYTVTEALDAQEADIIE